MSRPPGLRVYGKFEVKSAGLYLGSNPTQLAQPLTEDGVDEHRRIKCRRYDNCLAWAAAQGWISWSCSTCEIRESVELERPTRVGE